MPRNTFEWSTLVVAITSLVLTLLVSSIVYIFVSDKERQDVLIENVQKDVKSLEEKKVDKREFDLYRKSLTK